MDPILKGMGCRAEGWVVWDAPPLHTTHPQWCRVVKRSPAHDCPMVQMRVQILFNVLREDTRCCPAHTEQRPVPAHTRKIDDRQSAVHVQCLDQRLAPGSTDAIDYIRRQAAGDAGQIRPGTEAERKRTHLVARDCSTGTIAPRKRFDGDQFATHVIPKAQNATRSNGAGSRGVAPPAEFSEALKAPKKIFGLSCLAPKAPEKFVDWPKVWRKIWPNVRRKGGGDRRVRGGGGQWC